MKRTRHHKKAHHSIRHHGIEGFDGRGRHHRKSHRMHGMEGAQMRHVIVAGRGRHHKRHHSGLLMGGTGGQVVKRIGGNAANVAAGLAGAVVGAYVSSYLPSTLPTQVRTGAPLVVGLLVASTVKVPAVQFAGLGLSIAAGLAAVKQIFPSVRTLAGEVEIMVPPYAAPKQIGVVEHVSEMAGEENKWLTQDNYQG